jgi:hypothetical protein
VSSSLARVSNLLARFATSTSLYGAAKREQGGALGWGSIVHWQHGLAFDCNGNHHGRGWLKARGPFHLPCEPTSSPLSLLSHPLWQLVRV